MLDLSSAIFGTTLEMYGLGVSTEVPHSDSHSVLRSVCFRRQKRFHSKCI